ncbi:MAG: ATP-binding protein [Clostridia bacterium]
MRWTRWRQRCSSSSSARGTPRGSIAFTSSKSFSDWGQIFGDTVIAAAILDRLLHHSVVVNIRGESCRLREKARASLVAPYLQALAHEGQPQ